MANSGPPGSIKVFVGQIPKTYNETEIEPVFSPYGLVHEVFILRDKATSMHKGCAFVTMGNKKEAEHAIEGLHNNVTLPGANKALQVKFADSEQDKLECKLFIGMVPKSAVEEDVRSVFAQFGQIEDLVILRSGTESKGCAFVKYSSREECSLAIASLHGKFTMQDGTSTLVVRFADTEKAKLQKKQQQGFNQAPLMSLMAQMKQQQQPAAFKNPMELSAQSQYFLQQMQNPALTKQQQQIFAQALQTSQENPGIVTPQQAGLLPETGMGMDYGGVGTAQYGAAGAVAGNFPNYGMMAGAPGANRAAQREGPEGANLFVYHIPHHYGDLELMSTFATFGNVISSKVFVDKATHESKGFGFVSYDSPQSAQLAIQNMNGFHLGGKRLKVQLKTKNKQGGPY